MKKTLNFYATVGFKQALKSMYSTTPKTKKK